MIFDNKAKVVVNEELPLIILEMGQQVLYQILVYVFGPKSDEALRIMRAHAEQETLALPPIRKPRSNMENVSPFSFLMVLGTATGKLSKILQKPGKTGQTICKDPIQEIGFNHMLCRVILIKN